MNEQMEVAAHAPSDKRNTYTTLDLLSIADVLDFARRNLVLVGSCIATATSLGIIYILTATPLYTATGQLLLDVRVPQLANEQWREAGLVLDSAQVESQIAVLMSTPIAQVVARKLNLASDPEFNPLPGSAAAMEGSSSSAASKSGSTGGRLDEEALDKATSRVLGGLSIQRRGLSYVLEVSFTSEVPEKSARVANEVMHAFISDQIAMRAQAARQGSDWLEQRINTLRTQMNVASLKVQTFKARRDYSIAGRAEPSSDASSGLKETLEELEATAITYRRMFESALQAFTEAEQRQSYSVSNARIISLASTPTGKSSPKRMRVLVLATAVGLFLGLGLALVREVIMPPKDARS